MNRLTVIVLLVCLIVAAGAAFRADASNDAVGLAGQALRPFQGLVTGSGSGVGNFFEALREVGDLHAENQRLKVEVDAQEALKSRIIELERENYELRNLLSFVRERPDDRFLPARIIAWDPVSVVRSITIDRGRQDGIRTGMVVVTPLGLVGRVQRVTPGTAVVLLITDAGSSVSALVEGSRARGLVEGQREPVLIMRYIERDREVKSGDIVITSTLGGSFPEGLPIGQIVDVTGNDTSKFKEARLLPVVDFNRLEDVLVLTSFVPAGAE